MKNIILCIFLFLFACSSENGFNRYQKILSEADSITFAYPNIGKKVDLTTAQTVSFKEVFAEKIEMEQQRKFPSNVTIELFRKRERLAFFTISIDQNVPFANFNSDSLDFGFQLPYRVGMFIEEVK